MFAIPLSLPIKITQSRVSRKAARNGEIIKWGRFYFF